MSEKPASISREQLLPLMYFRNVYTLGKLALFVGLMAAFAWLSRVTNGTWGEWACYLGIGYLWMSLVTFMHEATHNMLFPKPWQNWLYGIVALLPVMVTFVAFKEDHLEHHKYNRSYRDPDSFAMGKRRIGDFILFYVYSVASLPLAMLHFSLLYPIQRFNARLWAIQIGEIVAKLVFAYGLVSWAMAHGVLNDVLEIWLWPMLPFSVLNSMRFVAEHYETPWNKGKLAGTRTILSNPVNSFFWNNINYHAGHHLYPRVPYFNLVKLYELLRPEIDACGGVVDKSYIAVFAKALARGPESEERCERFLQERYRAQAGRQPVTAEGLAPLARVAAAD